MTRRFQFSLRDLLWLVVVVSGSLGGMALQRRLDKPVHHTILGAGLEEDAITLPDGTTWIRNPFDEAKD